MASLLQIGGNQVKPGSLGASHFGSADPLVEGAAGGNKLVLDVPTSTLDTNIKAVSEKCLVVMLEALGVACGTAATLDISATIAAIYPTAIGGGGINSEGIVTTLPNNKVQLRLSSNGEPMEATPGGSDVYGRVEGTGPTFVLSFFSMNAGVETAFTPSSSVNIDLLVPVSMQIKNIPFNTLVTGVAFVDGLNATHLHTVSELADLTVSTVDINDLATLTRLLADGTGADTSGATIIGVNNAGGANFGGATNVQAALDWLKDNAGSPGNEVTSERVPPAMVDGTRKVFNVLNGRYNALSLAVFINGSKQLRGVVGDPLSGQYYESDPATGEYTFFDDCIPEAGTAIATDYDYV